ncbi:hypothetical protein GBZ48_28735 [Azospirillum melinis]|uniref:Uncharacterized protein n=1 Tax=Azospirillum melinis TaxID=328839 RepID=A0ABX2KKF0_9PROT|nr:MULTISPECIES: hypothetical protein [Azospirillum]MBP2307419.1 hypothetical protein [Azospirillum melinis]NUB03216.1 hypothetical protein [Azospirillum melinis]PWC59050.1 hypothetical protein TSH20_28575 [Azospirillum sp. TSH20]PWC60958.1 hypothetical protein TSH7_17655 [Azospirillum sp. TSH7]
MHATQPSKRPSSVHFLRGKMFIQTASAFPVAVSIADERQRQLERGARLRGWDDDGGAQPQEHAKE